MKMKGHALTLLVSLAIVVLSTIPIPEHPPLGDVPLIDKWVHMVMYGGLAFAMWMDRAWLARRRMSRGYWWCILLYPTILGGLMELVQAYVVTCRSGDWIDFEADAIGVVLAMACLMFTDKLWKEKISVRR